MADSVSRIVPPAISREPVSAERRQRERKRPGESEEPDAAAPANSAQAETQGEPNNDRNQTGDLKDKGKKLDIKA